MKKIDKKLYEHLGSQLKQARLAKGFSLAEVADMVGKSKVSIKRYEDASVRIDMDTLYLLCNVLGVRIKEYEISDGNNIVNRYVLEPITNDDDSEYQERIEFRKNLSISMFNKFMGLDQDTQRIVLLMLKMENIEEILKNIQQ